MAVILYREGAKDTVDGLPCEIESFVSETFDGNLPEGRYFSPRDIPANAEKVKQAGEAARQTTAEANQKKIDVMLKDDPEPRILSKTKPKKKGNGKGGRR